MATCKLCQQERPLVAAHVIPRAFYNSPGPNGPSKLITNAKGQYPRRIPIGVYDEGILCAECDGDLGVLDQHAAEALLQAAPADAMKVGHSVLARHYKSADPTKLHRFILSVAWRASVSSHIFFTKVKLGRYETLIRHALLDATKSTQPLETILGEFEGQNVVPLDPHPTRIDATRMWVVYAGKFIFYLKADQRAVPRDLAKLTLQPGRPVYSVVRPWNDSKEKELAVGLVKQNRGAFRREMA